MAYLSAGYYVTRLSDRGAHIPSELVPDKLLSASACICDFFPNGWAIAWASVTDEERLKRAAVFGVSSSGLPAVLEWATDAFSKDFGWPKHILRAGSGEGRTSKVSARGWRHRHHRFGSAPRRR